MLSPGEIGWVRLPVVMFVIGFALLIVAGGGPVAWDGAHHRNTEGRPGYDYATDAPLSGWDDPRLARRPGEAQLPFVRRVTRAVSAAIYHCEPGEPQTWATAILTRLSPAALSPQGFLAPTGLRCGYCSQVSFVVAETMRRNGIPSARARNLDGHVVVGFSSGGRDYATDADFGVGPIRVEWDNRTQLRGTIAATYPGTSLELVRPIYINTGTDEPYSRKEYLQALALNQGRWIELVEQARWVAVLCGAALLLAARRLSAPRSPRLESTVGLRPRCSEPIAD